MTELIPTLGPADLWLSPALLAGAALLLEAERFWTRAARRRGMPAPLMAYALDALAVASVLSAALLAGYGLFLGLRAALDAAADLAGRLIASPAALVGAAALVGTLLAAFAALRSRPHTPRRAPALAAQPTRPDRPSPESQPTRFVSLPRTPRADGATRRWPYASALSEGREGQHASTADADDAPAPDLVLFRQRRRAEYEPVPETFLPPPSVEEGPAKPPQQQAAWYLPLVGVAALVVCTAAVVVAFFPHLVLGPSAPALDVSTIFVESPGGNARPAPTSALAATSVPTQEPVAATVPPAPAQPVVLLVNVDSLNLRASAGPSHPVLSVLSRDTEVVLLGEETQVESSTWVRVRAGDAEGWVNRAFLR